MRRDVFGGPVADLLMLSFPLINSLKGQKKTAFRRAWINAANGEAMEGLGLEEGRLPSSPRAACEALLVTVMELGEAHGISRVDMGDYFNERGELGLFGKAENADEALRRCQALVALLAARRLQSDEAQDNRPLEEIVGESSRL